MTTPPIRFTVISASKASNFAQTAETLTPQAFSCGVKGSNLTFSYKNGGKNLYLDNTLLCSFDSPIYGICTIVTEFNDALLIAITCDRSH